MSNTTATQTRHLTILEEDQLEAQIKGLLLLIQDKYAALAAAQQQRSAYHVPITNITRLRAELAALETRFEQAIAEKERRTI